MIPDEINAHMQTRNDKLYQCTWMQITTSKIQ